MVASGSPSDRLAHYLATASSANPETAVSIIHSATSDPHLFHFSELLYHPVLSALSNHSIHSKSHNLLRLFAHGTISDYISNTSAFPPLTPDHLHKLRILTLISLCTNNSVVPYSTLQTQLSLNSLRQLEDLVLDAIYAGLLRARMNQRAAHIEILSAVGRDVVAPTGLSDMITTLKTWVSRSSNLVDEIDDKINYISDHAAQVKRQKAHTAALAAANYQSARHQQYENQRPPRASSSDLDAVTTDLPAHTRTFDDIPSLPNIVPHRSINPTNRFTQ